MRQWQGTKPTGELLLIAVLKDLCHKFHWDFLVNLSGTCSENTRIIPFQIKGLFVVLLLIVWRGNTDCGVNKKMSLYLQIKHDITTDKVFTIIYSRYCF